MLKSSKVFVKKVQNPNIYGVLELNNNEPMLIHEKPKENISNYCEVVFMEKNSVWYDSGDFDSLLSAANFVSKNNIS